MADRRMFSKAIIGSGRFLQMPPTSRLLYYDLGMAADDDGIVEAYSVMRLTGATEDDLRVLVAKGYIRILNQEMVSYITDWKVNNLIKNDRYKPSIYKPLLIGFEDVSKLEPNWNQTGTKLEPQYRIGKDSIGKDRIGEDRIDDDMTPTGDPLIMFAADNLVGMNADLADELVSYRGQMTDDMIRYAINHALSHGSRNFAYVRKVLNGIVERGFKTLAEVKAAEEERSKKQETPATPTAYGKPKKPMDSRDVKPEEFDDVFADIMNRPRSRRDENGGI